MMHNTYHSPLLHTRLCHMRGTCIVGQGLHKQQQQSQPSGTPQPRLTRSQTLPQAMPKLSQYLAAAAAGTSGAAIDPAARPSAALTPNPAGSEGATAQTADAGARPYPAPATAAGPLSAPARASSPKPQEPPAGAGRDKGPPSTDAADRMMARYMQQYKRRYVCACVCVHAQAVMSANLLACAELPPAIHRCRCC